MELADELCNLSFLKSRARRNRDLWSWSVGPLTFDPIDLC